MSPERSGIGRLLFLKWTLNKNFGYQATYFSKVLLLHCSGRGLVFGDVMKVEKMSRFCFHMNDFDTLLICHFSFVDGEIVSP